MLHRWTWPATTRPNGRRARVEPRSGGRRRSASRWSWRGYIEDNDYTRKHLTTESFADKGEAVVAAGEMLRKARNGEPPA